jgi:flagellar hook-basal body complex protein FliE
MSSTLSPRSLRNPLIISRINRLIGVHKLIQLGKIIEERISSLKEEVEIASNVQLNPIYVADRRDEIQLLEWTIRNINSTLIQSNQQFQQELAATKERQELTEIVKFENILKARIEELNVKLKNSKNLREPDILINETDTLECVLGHLANLKYGDKARAIEIEEANKNLKQAKYLREKLCDTHDVESEISAKMQKQNRYQL